MKYFCLIFVISCAFVYTQGIKIMLTGSEVDIDADYFTKPIIKVNQNGAESTIDVEGSALQQIDDVWVKAALLVDTPEGMKDFLKTPKRNLCEFFKNPETEPLLKMVYDDIGKYGNFSTSCPILKGFYYIHGFKIDSNKIPAMAPSGKYRLDVEMSTMVSGAEKKIYDAKWFSTIEN